MHNEHGGEFANFISATFVFKTASVFKFTFARVSIERRFFISNVCTGNIALFHRLRANCPRAMRLEGPIYSRITSTKSLSFRKTTFSASLTNLTARLPHSRGSSCYVSGTIPTPPPILLQEYTDLCARQFAHSPYLWHQPRLVNVICVWSRRLSGINSAMHPTYPTYHGTSRMPPTVNILLISCKYRLGKYLRNAGRMVWVCAWRGHMT
jgi:hypothetical protein